MLIIVTRDVSKKFIPFILSKKLVVIICNTNINYNWFKIDLCGTQNYYYKDVEMSVLIYEIFCIT